MGGPELQRPPVLPEACPREGPRRQHSRGSLDGGLMGAVDFDVEHPARARRVAQHPDDGEGIIESGHPAETATMPARSSMVPKGVPTAGSLEDRWLRPGQA